MPLFRRNSQKSDKSNNSDGEDHGLLGRLARLHSGSKEVPDNAQNLSTPVTSVLATHTKPQTQQSSVGVNLAPVSSSESRQHQHSSKSRERSAHDADARPSSRSSSKDRSLSKNEAAPAAADVSPDEKTKSTPKGDALNKDDIKHLFQGAPHFMLEPGRRHRAFPQAYFPFNSPLDTTDLQDRMYLRHESFALCSMHAHLPIPYEVNYGQENEEHIHRRDPFSRTTSASSSVGGENANADTQSASVASTNIGIGYNDAPEGRETSKRPMFDMGIYERPNMLSLGGVEPGTVGMRNFLERPVADGLVTHGKEEHGGKDSDIGYSGTIYSSADGKEIDLNNVSAFEAFKVLAHDEGHASIGKHAPSQNRPELLKGGPKAWKKIGVRGITMKNITERLEEASSIRDKVLEKGWRYTILDMVGADALGEQLFSLFLYSPGKLTDPKVGTGHGDLKVQIEALVKVLTTPGAWLDFSLPAERLLFAQNLYTREVKGEDVYGLLPEQKKRWALIQLLLAIELVIRLDAALRKGIALHDKSLPISNEEIHHFNKLRNLKVDWDLVIARRWLDLCYAKRMPMEIHRLHSHEEGVARPQEQRATSMFGRMKHSLSFKEAGVDDRDNTDWDVSILPRQSRVMGEGLIRFAADLGWPQRNVDFIRNSFIKKLREATQEEKETMLATGVEPLDHPHVPQHAMDSRTIVELKQATEKTLGGPLSHAWLGGLVVPGYFICDLLMCCLLEADPEALQKLGPMAHIRSGFVLDGKSYWSKSCIVGTVLAGMKGAKERMGWIALPENIGPVNEELESYQDGWRSVLMSQVPDLRDGARIFDGELLSKESSPLGVGHGKVKGREFSMVTDHILDDIDGQVNVENVELMLHKRKGDVKQRDDEYHASVGFQVIATKAPIGEGGMKQIRYPLKYNVQFVGAHPCRLPHGHVGSQASGKEDVPGIRESTDEVLGRQTTTGSEAAMSPGSEVSSPTAEEHHRSPSGTLRHPKHRHGEHLPAHPLHKSYKYMVKSIMDIMDLDANDYLPTPIDKEAGNVWVIDARGSWEREVLVRSWCAKVGRDAIVSRVGKSCLACGIREAKGLEVGILIRIGAAIA